MLLETEDPRAHLLAVNAARLRRDFASFVREAWPIVDPAPLLWGIHLDAMCLHLQAVAEGRIQRLLINVPPGCAKSMIVSVLWPAWRWARSPKWQLLGASYEAGLATRDATKARELMRSAWYRERFATDWGFTGDQNVKTYYKNTKGGHRLALGVGGKGTGYRGDCLIIDDPLSALDALSEAKRKEVITWKTETMSSRFNRLEVAEEVLIMQRLHEGDLSGYLLKEAPDEWVHVRLPSEYEPRQKCRTTALPKPPPGTLDTAEKRIEWMREAKPEPFWEDPREEKGDLLFPELFPRHVLAKAKTSGGMGAIAYAGQHQQQPMPTSGGIIQRAWLHRVWRLPSAEINERVRAFEKLEVREYDPHTSKPSSRTIVTDAAFKSTKTSDFVSIFVLDHVGPDVYVVDWVWRRMGFVDTAANILKLRAKWDRPGAHIGRVGIEDKANGPALIEVLKTKVPGVLGIEPGGSKEARITAASSYYHAGNVWLPAHHPQLEEGVAEAASFPRANYDDWIDGLTHGTLLLLGGFNPIEFIRNLTKWS